jgi:hypothetical protein
MLYVNTASEDGDDSILASRFPLGLALAGWPCFRVCRLPMLRWHVQRPPKTALEALGHAWLVVNLDCGVGLLPLLNLVGRFVMPQPLKPPHRFVMAGVSIQERPTLAARIGIIAAIWAEIEVHLALLFGALSETESRHGLEMYFAIVSTTARIDAMAAVARRCLPVDAMNAFEALLKEVRARARERNRIVHSSWGISLENKDILISVTQEDYVQSFYNMPHTDEKARAHGEIYSNPMAYSMTDFSEIERRLMAAQLRIMNFWRMLPGPIVPAPPRL